MNMVRHRVWEETPYPVMRAKVMAMNGNHARKLALLRRLFERYARRVS